MVQIACLDIHWATRGELCATAAHLYVSLSMSPRTWSPSLPPQVHELSPFSPIKSPTPSGYFYCCTQPHTRRRLRPSLCYPALPRCLLAAWWRDSMDSMFSGTQIETHRKNKQIAAPHLANIIVHLVSSSLAHESRANKVAYLPAS